MSNRVALDSVRLWTAALARLYFIYLVRPYAKRIARAIKKEPKVYFWDWSEVEHRFLVVSDLKQAGTAGDVHVIDAPTFCAALAV